MSKMARIWFGVAVATLLAANGAVAGVAGGAESRDQVSGSVATTTTSAAASSAVEYWTSRRMAHAEQMTVHPGRAASARTTAVTAGTSTGQEVSIPPSTGALGGDALAAMTASRIGRPYTNAPDRMNAKIFFTMGGGNYVCSGTVVNSATRRMVSTAGHCVSDGNGRFHGNVIVVPGYSSKCNGCGDAPFGRWSARYLTTTTEWHRYSNFKQDLGYIITNDRNGTRIVNQVGGQGSRFNAARSQQFRSYGYPQAPPFNGYNQYVCPSRRLADDNPTSQPGPLTIRISCNMTGGSSGGGWIIDQSGGLGWVNGVNSYKYVAGPKENANHMYGPYFGNAALSLFNFTVDQG